MLTVIFAKLKLIAVLYLPVLILYTTFRKNLMF